MSKDISRRTFLKTVIGTGAGLYGLSYLRTSRKRQKTLKKFKESGLAKDTVVVHAANNTGGKDEAETVREMTTRALAALGGMEKLVSRGDRVVIKPNISWNRAPEFAANTNPHLVAALAGLCLDAGASRVRVMDHPCSSNPKPSYKISRIEEAARRAGAEAAYVDKSRFRELLIPGGKVLKSWAFNDAFVLEEEVDVLINVPIAKHHSTSRLTMALKNVFGMVGWDRGRLHKDIHPKIADLNRVVKVDLTVLDAYRVLKRHGPTGGRLDDVDNSVEGARRIVVSTDPVAVDSYGATLFGFSGKDIRFIREAHEAGIGEIDYKRRGFEEIII
ncbi:MAG: DUF362 domain-containing protein [Candidatus Brocadiales bacterium]|nr:DUF362 domain-containing protein [Candidatus Bathyanammoxibius amoris]